MSDAELRERLAKAERLIAELSEHLAKAELVRDTILLRLADSDGAHDRRHVGVR